MKILVMITLCITGNLCYKRTEPMPEKACIEYAASYNKSKSNQYDFAYCENVK